MIDTIVFDNDGTLSDSVEVCGLASNAALKNHGFDTVSMEELSAGMGMDTVERMMHHANITDRTTGNSLADQFYTEWLDIVDQVQLFPGIFDMLVTLKERKYTLGLLSNSRHNILRNITLNNRIHSFFSVILGEDDVPETKPLPGGLLKACRLAGSRPETTVYVGDSLADSKAARAAGMKSVGVQWNPWDTASRKQMGFDELAASPRQLCEQFTGVNQ